MGGTGALETVIAALGQFGNCCAGSFADQGLTLHNNGPCRLAIEGISSSAPEFLAPTVTSYPLVVAAGGSVTVPIRFRPAAPGPASAAITITSDDPAGPKVVRVSGNAPAGQLAVTGSAFFGGVHACCHAERTIAICNVGQCQLHVTGVAFRHENPHWKLINNPFPATLPPGSCLSVVISYHATEKFPRSCDLVITSDDPATPVKTLEVVAYTIWDECGQAGGDCGCRRTECHRTGPPPGQALRRGPRVRRALRWLIRLTRGLGGVVAALAGHPDQQVIGPGGVGADGPALGGG